MVGGKKGKSIVFVLKWEMKNHSEMGLGGEEGNHENKNFISDELINKSVYIYGSYLRALLLRQDMMSHYHHYLLSLFIAVVALTLLVLV